MNELLGVIWRHLALCLGTRSVDDLLTAGQRKNWKWRAPKNEPDKIMLEWQGTSEGRSATAADINAAVEVFLSGEFKFVELWLIHDPSILVSQSVPIPMDFTNYQPADLDPIKWNDIFRTVLPHIHDSIRVETPFSSSVALLGERRISGELPSCTLTEHEELALVIYTYAEIGRPRTEQFYYAFNECLRRRELDKLDLIKPFIRHLLYGVKKLTPFKGTVWRGIPAKEIDFCRKEYYQGVNVHWTAFTSTSRSLLAAQEKAGEGGIVFEIIIFEGRSIAPYSHYQDAEDEVLLYPFGLKYTVISGWNTDHSGFWHLKLLQTTEHSFVY
jgi:hypothetical protein